MKPSQADEAVLTEIRSRFEYAWNEWADTRAEADKDMRYVAGDPWSDEDKKARKKAGRPCLVLDELGQHFNQVINGRRANKRAIKFAPVGGGADDKTADFYRDKTREIEYRSHAQIAYTTAFQDAIHRSYGFVRLTTKYKSDTSFNQEIWIEPVPNPDMVLPDPDAKRPDSSDMKYCFVYEHRTHEEFTREFPDAQMVDFGQLVAVPEYKLWLSSEKVLIAEYWTITTKRRRLLLIQPPAVPSQNPLIPSAAPKPIEVFEDEIDFAALPAGAKIVKERTVDVPSVCQYLTNGVEILKKQEWPGKYIPIASCYGMVIWVDGKRKIISMTRLARDPYMAYCYAATGAIEVAGSTTKNPYWAYEGQLSPTQLNKVAESLHQPVAVLLAKPTTEANPQQLLPLPQRNNLSPDIGGWTVLMEFFRRSIQSSMGTAPLPTQAQRKNEKSGVALQQIEESAQRGSYHFDDHGDDLVRFVGVMIEDLIDKIHSEVGETGIRKPNDESESVPINDPRNPKSVSTKGDHLVTVSTGPNFESEEQAAEALADGLMASPFAPQIIDLAVKLRAGSQGGGPVVDEIVDRLTPPQFRKPSENGQPSPADVAHLQSQLQQVNQVAQQMAEELKTKKAEIDSKERIAAADREAENQRKQAELHNTAAIADMESRRRAETQIAVAEIGSKAKDAALFLEERARIGVQQQAGQQMAHEAVQNEQDRQHEAAMADLEHQQALEQGQQSADLGMVQASHQQAIQPPEQAGGGA